MKLQYFGAASIVIHTKEKTKILCDPWFETPAFIGSWIPFPKVEFNYDEKYDYVYISHIHSDHFDMETLSRINQDTKILIYKFENPFLFRKIKSMGFTKIIQLEHGQEFFVDKITSIKIYGPVENNSDAKQQVIDTSIIIKDNDHTILNFNDNIYELKDKTLHQIKKEHPNVDVLCHGYTSASSYPQCTVSLSRQEMINEKNRVRKICYDRSIKLIKYLNPKDIMPFAGYYILCGKNSNLNKMKANDHPYDALNYYKQNAPCILQNRQCILLNVHEYYDLNTKKYSKPYKHFTKKEMFQYIEKNKNVKYPYENDIIQIPSIEKYIKLIDNAYGRMETTRKKMNYSTDTKILIKLPEDQTLLLTMNGDGFKIIDNNKFSLEKQNNFVLMDIDFRLLYMLLQGPRFAHWDNADHGSHIKYYKKPNLYEKGLYHLICHFHE